MVTKVEARAMIKTMMPVSERIDYLAAGLIQGIIVMIAVKPIYTESIP